MTIFIGSAVFITLLVIILLIYPLLRSKTSSGISFERSNIDIYRDQLKTLETDFKLGVIDKQNFDSTRDELQLRLLDDASNKDLVPTISAHVWHTGHTIFLLTISIPVLAFLIYFQIGSPGAIDHKKSVAMDNQKIEQMVASLANKLRINPNNPAAWLVLARSYKVMGKFEAAKQAFENAGAYLHSEPDALIDYATVLGILNNNKLDQQATKIINEVLLLNPNHPDALMLSGVSSYQQADYYSAIQQWQKLLGMLDPNSASAQQIQFNIIDAQLKSSLPINGVNKIPSTDNIAQSETIKKLIQQLLSHLKTNPNDYLGWVHLANAYKAQGKLTEALQAFEKAGPLLQTDANIISQYANLLAMHNQGRFQGKTLTMINKALSIDPKQASALMLAAQAAYQGNDYSTAIRYWETVLSLLPNDSPYHKFIATEITNAKDKLNTK